MKTTNVAPRPGYRLIFRPWITNHKTGERIYPKRAKFFALWVKD
jgi:hypothetical protein